VTAGADPLVTASAGPTAAPSVGRGHRAWPVAFAVTSYTALSVGVLLHVWVASSAAVMTCPCTDAGRTAWYLAWTAHALAHGQAPWYSTALFHPRGFSTLVDTSVPALGVVAAPLTLAAGPVVSMNVLSTLTPVAGALAMWWALGRLGIGLPARWLGGLWFGFSPFVLVQLAFGWLDLAFVPLVPLVAVATVAAVRPGPRQRRAGVALGLLVVAEFFVSSELCLLVVVCLGLALLGAATVTAVHDGAATVERARRALPGLGVAVGIAAVLLAVPVWYFLAGPGHLSGTVWSNAVPGDLGNAPVDFVSTRGQWGPVSASQLAQLARVLGGYAGPPLPSPADLGVGLLAVWAAALWWWRRDAHLWGVTVLAAAAAVLSLRAGPTHWSPWALVEHLPVLDNVVQARLAVVVDLCAAAVLAVVVDRLATDRLAPGGVPERRDEAGARPVGWRGSSAPHAGGGRRRIRAAAAGACALVAIVPLVVALAPNLPLAVQPVRVPPWFTGPGRELPAGAVVLPYPFPTADTQSALLWQALAGFRFAMPGGGGPAGTVARARLAGFAMLRDASLPTVRPPDPDRATLDAVRAALRRWGVTTVVVPDGVSLAHFDRGRGDAYGVAFLTAVLGAVPRADDGAWVWSVGSVLAPPVPTTSSALANCAELAGDGGATVAGRGTIVSRCVLQDVDRVRS
jgi:hypothetical protein